MTRKYHKKTEPMTKPFSLRVPISVKAEIDNRATARNVTRSIVFNEAIIKGLDIKDAK